MTWRLTFSEGSTVPATAAQMSNVFTPEGFLKPDVTLVAPHRMELRGAPSQIVRMAAGSELILKQMQLGVLLEYFGETVIMRKTNNCGKYRTSCWCCTFPAEEQADFLVRPAAAQNTDEFLVFTGNLDITEFDEENRAFGIAFVEEGKKLTLQYDPNLSGPARYTVVSIDPLTPADYNYFLTNYLDPQSWTI